MKTKHSILPPALLLVMPGLVSPEAKAQAGAVETTANGIVSLVSDGGATGVNAITHEFTIRKNTAGAITYPRALRVNNTGRVGIGFDLSAGYNPASLLSVGDGVYNLSMDEVGSARLKCSGSIPGIPGAGGCLGFNAARQSDADFGCSTNGTNNGGALIWGDLSGGLCFATLPNNGGAAGAGSTAAFYSPTYVAAHRVMKLGPTGQVQIGLMAPSSSSFADYRLAVDGKIVAKSVFVALQSASWADFVFEPTYQLLPLPALETYLQKNKHLPAIPSAREVAQTGLDLGEMQARLLQSLEELTLHVIELSKQNQRLQAEVTALAAKVSQTPVADATK